MKNNYLVRSKQFVKFGLVGLSNTLIALGIYSLLVYLGFHYQIGNIASFLLSSFTGFILNKFWVFKSHEKKALAQIIKYYTVYCSSLLISMLLSYVWIDFCKIDVYITPLLNLTFTVPYNFILSKKWVYVRK